MNLPNFLQTYGIEIPEPSALGLLHSERVRLYRGLGGWSFSQKALALLDALVAPSGLTARQWNVYINDQPPRHYEILFFFDGPYQMEQHIWSIRNSKREAVMSSCVDPSHRLTGFPAPAGLLQIADVDTLRYLAERSPFLTQLLPLASGQKAGQRWAYFLGRCIESEVEAEDHVPEPV
jgi:hypothetical protein